MTLRLARLGVVSRATAGRPPELLANPTHAGTHYVGEILVATSNGVWAGAETLDGDWLRDGTPIAGETDPFYTLADADDGTDVRWRVEGANEFGTVFGYSDAVAVTYAPPVATGGTISVEHAEDSGDQTLDMKSYFTVLHDASLSSVTWSISPAVSGYSIDSGTGVLTIPTADPVVGQIVQVVATTSGGTAMQPVSVTVTATPSAWSPPYMVADGLATMTFGGAQANDQQFSIWFDLEDTDAMADWRDNGLFAVWGRLDVWIDEEGKLNVTAERSFNSFILRWRSSAAITAAGASRLLVSIDLAAEAFVAEINETPVAGTFLEGDPSSANWTVDNLIFSRDAFSFLSLAQGTGGVVTDIARDLKVRAIWCKFGATAASSDFYDGANYIDPATVNSPSFCFYGDATDWNAGLNRGSLGNAARQGNFFVKGGTPNAPVYIGNIFSPSGLTVGVAMDEIDLRLLYVGYQMASVKHTGPSWLSVASNTISGTPDAVGTDIPVRVDVSNGGGMKSLIFDVDVAAAPVAPAYLGTFALQHFLPGQAGSYSTIEHFSGSQPLTFGMTGAPTGITINTSSGLVSVAATTADGIYALTVTATNAAGAANGTLTVVVGAWAKVGQSTFVVTPGSGQQSVALPAGMIQNDFAAVQTAFSGADAGGLSWVVFDGTDSLRIATEIASDNAVATMAFALRDVVTGSQMSLHDLTGRGDVRISASGDIVVRACTSASSTPFTTWSSNGEINVAAAGNHSLVIQYNLTGASPAINVTWDGVAVAGAYSVGPVAGVVDWTRAGNGIGSTHSATAEFLRAEMALFYLKIGALISPSNFYAAGEPVVYTGNSPEVLFHGAAAAWQSGANLGSIASTWTPAATFADGAGGSSTPPGWTVRVSGNTPASRLYTKLMGATPDATISISRHATRKIAGLVQVWRGVDPVTPLDNGAATVAVSSTDNSAVNPPAYTSITDDALFLAAGFLDNDDAASNVVVPSGYGDLIASDTGDAQTNGTGATAMLASKVKSTAGAEDAGVFNVGPASDAWRAALLALRPAANVGGGGDPLSGVLFPDEYIGFGAGTTGGLGGPWVPVTNLANSTAVGTLRWALETQHIGQPINIALCVQGLSTLPSSYQVTRPNVSIFGEFAPGPGYIQQGGRIWLRANNIVLNGYRHWGNDMTIVEDTPSNNADCANFGQNDNTTGSSSVQTLGVAYRCSFLYGRDETLTTYPHNDGSTNTAKTTKLSFTHCIIADATLASHRYAIYIGDNTQELTLARNLISNFEARMPFVEDKAVKLEILNNFIFGGEGGNWLCQLDGENTAIFEGNHWRMGPGCSNTGQRGVTVGSGSTYRWQDNVMDSKVGKTSPQFPAGTGVQVSSPFTASGAPIMALNYNAVNKTSDVEAYMTSANVGPLRYGANGNISGGNSIEAQAFVDAKAGTKTYMPDALGPLPTFTSETFPTHDGTFIPANYKTVYGLSASVTLADTISDGGDFDGLPHGLRVKAFLQKFGQTMPA